MLDCILIFSAIDKNQNELAIRISGMRIYFAPKKTFERRRPGAGLMHGILGRDALDRLALGYCQNQNPPNGRILFLTDEVITYGRCLP
jgi:hypothetical protein